MLRNKAWQAVEDYGGVFSGYDRVASCYRLRSSRGRNMFNFA